MPTIYELSSVDTIAQADSLPLFSLANGDTRKISFANLQTAVLDGYEPSQPTLDFVVHNYTPTTGFIINVTETSSNVFLLLTPSGTLASGTINLPLASSLTDGIEVLVFSTKQITALTINGNGATMANAPTTVAADGSFKLRFHYETYSWYRLY